MIRDARLECGSRPKRPACCAPIPVDDLFAPSHLPSARAIAPLRELGAYEALWLREGTTFRSLAHVFRTHPGALPSDFVSEREAVAHGDRVLEAAAAGGRGTFGITVHGMPDYPHRLRSAASPVELLYHQGRLGLLSARCLAIVGTRHPSREGERCAGRLAHHFAQAGFTIVSGLARGIDAAAHSAAIEAGGATAAVLGTPLTVCFPRQHERLQRQLADDYLVVSQVPILRYARQSRPDNRCFFRERNATVAALAEALILVEADDRSGALIPARHALEQGRPVFIPESAFRRPELGWPARLAARGAVQVRRISDIESHLAA
jgi:DNA processing protein